MCVSHHCTDVSKKCVYLGPPAGQGIHLLTLFSHCIRQRREIAVHRRYAVERVLPLLQGSAKFDKVLTAAYHCADSEHRRHCQRPEGQPLYWCIWSYLRGKRTNGRCTFDDCH
jgi:hypothetical protein